MIHTTKYLEMFTDDPEGCMTVARVHLEGCTLVPDKALRELRTGGGGEEMYDLLNACRYAMTDKHGQPRNAEMAKCVDWINNVLEGPK